MQVCPVAEQLSWHSPPQPSSPQHLPSQSGEQASHWPVLSLQDSPDPHPGGHVPPQPSDPQTLPSQSGAQSHSHSPHPLPSSLQTWNPVAPPEQVQSICLPGSQVWRSLEPQDWIMKNPRHRIKTPTRFLFIMNSPVNRFPDDRVTRFLKTVNGWNAGRKH